MIDFHAQDGKKVFPSSRHAVGIRSLLAALLWLWIALPGVMASLPSTFFQLSGWDGKNEVLASLAAEPTPSALIKVHFFALVHFQPLGQTLGEEDFTIPFPPFRLGPPSQK